MKNYLYCSCYELWLAHHYVHNFLTSNLRETITVDIMCLTHTYLRLMIYCTKRVKVEHVEYHVLTNRKLNYILN